MTKFGYLDLQMAECLDVDYILLDGDKIISAVRVNDVEGWVEMYDTTRPLVANEVEIVRKTGSVEIVWFK